ncbi:MAG: hypothetical protein HFF64_06375 [Oscillospiraceae bacterium]|nr:hypothetical protein [Oscillospiraceae bacterium]
MNNEEKILEMLAAMQTRQEKTEEMLAAMQGSITTMQGDIVSMQGDIKNINGRLDSIEEKLDDLTEAHEVTRDGVNALLEWSDRVSSIKELRIPRI